MGVLRVLSRHLRAFGHTWKYSVMFNVVEPLLYLTAFGFGLNSFIGEMNGMSYLEFLAPGIVAGAAMYATTFGCTYGTFTRLHYQKTFLAMLAGPITVRDVVFGEILYGVLRGVLFGTIVLISVAALGLIKSPQALAIPLLLAVQGVTFAALAIWYTSLITNMDYLNYYITLLILPFFLFSGLYFPASVLPAWAQAINFINPLYHSLEVCRALALGQAVTGLWLHVGVLVLMGLLVLPLPLRLMRKRLIN